MFLLNFRFSKVRWFRDEEHSLISAVACGAHHSVFVSDTGAVYCVGWNEYGQVGIAASPRVGDEPFRMEEDTGARWLAIGAVRKVK